MSQTTDYSAYLRIDELLDLQRPLTPGADDELLFIVVHQVYELWFKLLLSELERARDALLSGDAHRGIAPLRRARVVDELMIQQLGLLETMSPDGFLAFRDPLAPASGFQSFQFRAIEAVGGTGDPRHLEDPGWTEAHRQLLRGFLDSPDLYTALCTCFEAHGIPMPAGEAGRPARLAGLGSLYHDHQSPERTTLHLICELLLDHDEALARWRFQHVLMAAREIGSRQGTGGSQGVAYLETTLQRRCFPELWAVRSRL